MKLKINSICVECGLGWRDLVIIKGVEYLKCNTCGHTTKVSKKIITPIGKHEKENSK